MSAWRGVDLDRTVAFYDKWRGADHVGEALMPMVDRMREWMDNGERVCIVTARVASDRPVAERAAVADAIHTFCRAQFGRALPITSEKTYDMIELWDDRAVQMIPNTGLTLLEVLLPLARLGLWSADHATDPVAVRMAQQLDVTRASDFTSTGVADTPFTALARTII